jgi:hypothetical protein
MPSSKKALALCVDNEGYEASLERRKIYLSLPDARAEKLGQVRVIDESGDEYFYPKESFITEVW